jgi:hypothetical protein
MLARTSQVPAEVRDLKMTSRKTGILIGVALAIMVVAVAVNGTAVAVDTPYAASIVYKQTNTLILDHEDIKGWPDDVPDSDSRQFTGVMVSAGGSRVLFSACVYYTAIGTDCRPFLVDPDGTGLQDVSSVFPADIVSRSWGWGNMRINDDGSRFFIKVHRYDDSPYLDEVQIYYYDILGGASGRAEIDGFYPPGFDWFNINATGSRFYHGKYDNGPSEGLWYTNFGGTKTSIVDVGTLPCDPGTAYATISTVWASLAARPRATAIFSRG